MDDYYHNWLEIEIINNYFPNGVCPVVNLVPIEETATVMRNNKMLLRRHSNVFSFYVANKEQHPSNIFTEFEGLNTLYFQVQLEDPLFFNYTNLPDVPENHICLFHNTPSASGLQQNTAVSSADLVPIRQKELGLDNPRENDIVEIKDENGIDTFQKTVYITNDENIQIEFPPVNLSALGSGKYQVWVNGSQVGDTFYHFDTRLAENCIGIVRIDLEPIIAAGDSNVKLSLHFQVRKVHWQYKVINADNRALEMTLGEVKDTDNDFSNPNDKIYVKHPELKQIIGGQEAQVYTSQFPKKLRQQPSENPELTIASGASRTTEHTDLTLKLPNPSAENLETYITPDGTNSICATVIVYV